MDLAGFNCSYLHKLLQNIPKEQKSICLLGGCNVNPLNYNERNQTNGFIDSLASNSYLPFYFYNQPEQISILIVL